MGRVLLPVLGGAPAVWITTQLFFQVALLGGYAYGHLIGARLIPRRQTGLHLGLLALGLLVLGACAGFAWVCARSTTYTITTERCVLRFGVALDATLSVPLHRVASVSLAMKAEGAGNIPLALKPGAKPGSTLDDAANFSG